MPEQYSNVRIPFLVSSYSDRNIAVPKELLMDYNTGVLYIKNNDADIVVGLIPATENLNTAMATIIQNVSDDGNTLKKLRDLIHLLELWKNTMVNTDIDNVINIIRDKFRDMNITDPTLKEQLNGKVNKDGSKTLTTNDFTTEFLNKLNSIDNNANKYVHPSTKVCNYVSPIVSVNGRTDTEIVITKEELGLGNVEPNANNYVHPAAKQCSVNGISSINGLTGVVTLTKSSISLENVQNYTIATDADVVTLPSNKYITPLMGAKIMKHYVDYKCIY